MSLYQVHLQLTEGSCITTTNVLSIIWEGEHIILKLCKNPNYEQQTENRMISSAGVSSVLVELGASWEHSPVSVWKPNR